MRHGPDERGLITYYDNEAEAGTRRRLRDFRVDLNDHGADVARAAGGCVLDVGAGPGLDAARFRAAGLEVVGLDLAHGNAEAMATAGVPSVTGSLFRLPVADEAVGAVWSMSTLVHVDDGHLHAALAELRRVVRRDGVMMIGSWGGRDWEGAEPDTPVGPPRFFSLRSHGRWIETMRSLGCVERFDTYETDQPGWEYQFAVIRPGQSA